MEGIPRECVVKEEVGTERGEISYNRQVKAGEMNGEEGGVSGWEGEMNGEQG